MIDNSNIRAAFFDVDGTLLRFNTHTVPVSAARSLDQLKGNGIFIFIASGRSANNLQEISDLPYDGVVGLNGTECVLRDGTLVSRHPIPVSAFRRLLEISDEKNIAVSLETPDGTHFVNRITPRVIEEAEMVAHPLPIVTNLMDEFLPDVTTQICLYTDNSTETDILSRIPVLASSRWCNVFADINVSGVDKGSGLIEMMKFYNLDSRTSIAIGDGGNDIPMLRAAGIGVAMGNASESVRNSADYVTERIDNDGVASALKSFELI